MKPIVGAGLAVMADRRARQLAAEIVACPGINHPSDLTVAFLIESIRHSIFRKISNAFITWLPLRHKVPPRIVL